MMAQLAISETILHFQYRDDYLHGIINDGLDELLLCQILLLMNAIASLPVR